MRGGLALIRLGLLAPVQYAIYTLKTHKRNTQVTHKYDFGTYWARAGGTRAIYNSYTKNTQVTR